MQNLGAINIADQSSLFYKQRQPGELYVAPFQIANIAKCSGIANQIVGEENVDVWLAVVDDLSPRDRGSVSAFLAYDLPRYNIRADVLSDPLLSSPSLSKYTYLKKSCQETYPNQADRPYGQPFTFYEQ